MSGNEAARSAGSEIVVEIDTGDNGNVIFNPLKKVLRGRWDVTKLPPNTTTDSGLLDIRELPGLRIGLDLTGKKARVFDPLGGQQYKDLSDKTMALLQRMMGRAYKPVETTHYELDQSGLATWHYWVKRLVESGRATLVSGRFPEKAPEGRVVRDWYANTHDAPRYADEMEAYYGGTRSAIQPPTPAKVGA